MIIMSILCSSPLILIFVMWSDTTTDKKLITVGLLSCDYHMCSVHGVSVVCVCVSEIKSHVYA